MTANALMPNIKILTDNTFSIRELAFITAYMANGFNASRAVIEAGYKVKAPENYGGALLRRAYIKEEIQAQLQAIEDKKIADALEIQRFYTSVMRGEVLDQFGIECSVDTRIKAANELAKWKIEMPMKLEQKDMSNNIGSITLNFLPRKEEE